MEEQSVFGYAFEGERYDAGTTMGWLQASVELALARPDIGHRVPGVPALAGHLTAPRRRPVDAALTDGCARMPAVAGRGRTQRGDTQTVTEIGSTLGGRYRLVELLGPGWHGHDLPRPRRPAGPRRRGQAPPARVRRRTPTSSRASATRPGAAASLSHPNIVARVRLRRGRVRARTSSWSWSTAQDLASIMRDNGPLAAAPGGPRRRGGRRGPPGGARPRASSTATSSPSTSSSGRDGRIKVADFGIARAVSEAQVTLPGTTMGSVHYFSPEQARGEPATALGHLRAGHRPVRDAHRPAAVLGRRRRGHRARPPDDRPRRCPSALRRVSRPSSTRS